MWDTLLKMETKPEHRVHLTREKKHIAHLSVTTSVFDYGDI